MGKPFSLKSPEQVAKEYGGNKEKIRQAMAMGLVDPTAGVLGGMFIDRMRSAQSLEQGAQPTVAQQVLAPPAPASAPPAPPASGAAKFFGAPPPMAPQAPPMGMASGGLTTLPIPDNMFDEQQYGGGGIVAFSGKEGSDVKLTDEMLIKAILDPRAPAEERAAARQELQNRRGPVSDYGTPRTAEDTRAAFERGLPQGIVEVAGGIGRGVANSQFGRDVASVPAALQKYGTSLEDPTLANALSVIDPIDAISNAAKYVVGAPRSPKSSFEESRAADLGASVASGDNATRAGRGATGTWEDHNAAVQDAAAEKAAAAKAAAEKAAAAKAAAPRGPRVDPEVAKAVADVAEAAPVTEKDYAAHYADAMAAREGYPTLPAGESIADQKKQDFNMALAQMGFGIAAGTSPYALTNIGAGAAGAVPGMQKAMDRRRESQRDAEKADFARREAVYGQQNAARTEALGLVEAGKRREDALAKLAQDASEGGLDRASAERRNAATVAASLQAAQAGRDAPTPALREAQALMKADPTLTFSEAFALTQSSQADPMLALKADAGKAAQNDERWRKAKTPEDRKALVDEYMRVLYGVSAAAPDTATDLLVKKYGGE
jgi:hypothetical protein